MIATEGRRVVREKADRGKKLSLSALVPYRRYNQDRMEDWLGSYTSSSKGPPKTHPDELIIREHLGPQGPGSMSFARLESLLSEDIRITDWLLKGVVDELRRQKFESYLNLMKAYFGMYASEGEIDHWRNSKRPLRRLRYEMAVKSLDWMLEEAEKSLADLGRRRLVVLPPWATVNMAEELVENERERKERKSDREKSGRPTADEAEMRNRLALDVYFKKLDQAEEEAEMYDRSRRWIVGEAMKMTVAETGYTKQRLYKLLEGLNRPVPEKQMSG